MFSLSSHTPSLTSILQPPSHLGLLYSPSGDVLALTLPLVECPATPQNSKLPLTTAYSTRHQVMVFEKGELAEYDSPQALLAHEDSLFSSLVDKTGAAAAQLRAMATEAARSRE